MNLWQSCLDKKFTVLVSFWEGPMAYKLSESWLRMKTIWIVESLQKVGPRQATGAQPQKCLLGSVPSPRSPVGWNPALLSTEALPWCRARLRGCFLYFTCAEGVAQVSPLCGLRVVCDPFLFLSHPKSSGLSAYPIGLNLCPRPQSAFAWKMTSIFPLATQIGMLYWMIAIQGLRAWLL